MFSPRKKPLLLVADRLLALRLSLNTPVVATADLPAGPARAAIVVHGEAGRTCFTVAVRSLRNGDSVLYELEGEDPNDASGIAVALDAALSFAESMGFLFDDDLVTERREPVLRAAWRSCARSWRRRARSRARRRRSGSPCPRRSCSRRRSSWSRPRAARRRGAEPAGRGPASPSSEPPRPGASAPGEGRRPEGPVPRATRRPGATGRKAPGGGAMLGRVKPVRLRAPGRPPPVSALLRLLTSF
jgi:hypothetical protein